MSPWYFWALPEWRQWEKRLAQREVEEYFVMRDQLRAAGHAAMAWQGHSGSGQS